MVFGSTARGDADAQSDRDLLLVASGKEDLFCASEDYSKYGWSCSLYLWAKLKSLCANGGYFLEHLRREGIIVHDKDDELAHALSTAREKTDYRREIESALSIFSAIEFVPSTHWGPSWALDVLMVAVRSYGYATLANNGIFIFNFNKMIDTLATIEGLSSEEAAILKKLRKWKYKYRQKTASASWGDLVEVVRVADKLLHAGAVIKLREGEGFLENAVKNYREERGWYANARLLEAAIILSPVGSQEVIGKLTAPQEYSGLLGRLDYRSYLRVAKEAYDHSLDSP
jgi:predicted nucleotidyltransferase